MTTPSKIETLKALVEKSLTLSQAAAQLGATEAEVAQWKELYEMGCEIAAHNERAASKRLGQRGRRAAVGLAAMAAVVAGAWSIDPTWAQATCTQTLPAPLKTLCANAPAIAADVNGNTQQVVNWLTQKTGPVGSPNVAVTGTLAVSGTLTATGATSLQGVTATGVSAGTGTFSTANISTVSATAVNTTTLNVGGAASFGGVGGNVPFGCVSRVQTGSYNTACAANEIAVGGGGRCSSGWRLTESLPWNGPNDTDGPPGNGSIGRAWRSVCQVWGNAFTYAAPQMGSYAVCCKQ